MRIAVCSKDFKSVSGHAGQARNWLLFQLYETGAVEEVKEISLTRAQTFHHFKDVGPHPLDGISALIAISAGESFLTRMRKGGIDAMMTAESDPEKAVGDYLKQQLSPPKPRPIGELLCKLRDAFSDHS
jgi:predicted Fe-Mo cluster-binding NifX family protein